MRDTDFAETALKILIGVLIIVLIIGIVIGITTSLNDNKTSYIILHSPLVRDEFKLTAKEGYTFNYSHLWDEVETEDGIDVVLHLIKE